jgi:hypothetical protein
VAEARHVLAEAVGWFAEGLDTQDVRAAHALLAELGAPPSAEAGTPGVSRDRRRRRGG